MEVKIRMTEIRGGGPRWKEGLDLRDPEGDCGIGGGCQIPGRSISRGQQVTAHHVSSPKGGCGRGVILAKRGRGAGGTLKIKTTVIKGGVHWILTRQQVFRPRFDEDSRHHQRSRDLKI